MLVKSKINHLNILQVIKIASTVCKSFMELFFLLLLTIWLLNCCTDGFFLKDTTKITWIKNYFSSILKKITQYLLITKLHNKL